MASMKIKISHPFFLSVHQDSKSSLDRPDCIIPGLELVEVGMW